MEDSPRIFALCWSTCYKLALSDRSAHGESFGEISLFSPLMLEGLDATDRQTPHPSRDRVCLALWRATGSRAIEEKNR